MHVRADTASLHAACTSVGGEPDQLLLQTDWNFPFQGKKVVYPSEKDIPEHLLPYFTYDYDKANFKNQPNAANGPKKYKYGITLFDISKKYFQIQQALGMGSDIHKQLYVKRCENQIDQTILFDDDGPIGIKNWQPQRLWPEHPKIYIRNPEEYFAQTAPCKQNKWPLGKPDGKKVPAARVLPYAPRHEYDYNPDASWTLPVATMLRTQISESLNPYVVQRCRADRALDPDASWQTDGGPWLQWPKYFRRTRQIAPEPSESQSKKFKATMIRRTDRLNFVSAEYEVLVEHAHTADARFNYIKNHYWTSPSFDTAVACQGNWDGALVYTCYYQRGLKLFLCYCVGHPSEHKGKFVWIKKGLAQDIITQKLFQDILQVPKDNFNVCWFTNNESLLRTNSFNQKKRGV